VARVGRTLLSVAFDFDVAFAFDFARFCFCLCLLIKNDKRPCHSDRSRTLSEAEGDLLFARAH